MALLLLAGSILVSSSCASNSGGAAPSSQVAPSASTAARPTPSPEPDGEVTIAAVGDVMLARDLTTLMERNGAAYPYERVDHLLQDADLTIANLEIALTERGEPVEKLYNFRTPPRFASGLVDAGVDIVALGNNHTADYGVDGIEDTIAAVASVGLLASGAGMDDTEARTPAIAGSNGLRIAFLSYTDQFINTFAGPGQPGVALAEVATIVEDVAAARKLADIVVVSLHSGIEYTDEPTSAQIELSQAAVDAGALLVLGHHAHALQGVVEYGGGLIAYGLGNFVFDLDADDLESLGPRAFETVVLYVTLREDEVVGVRMEPVFIDPVENRPRPATDDEANAILDRIEELNVLAELVS